MPNQKEGMLPAKRAQFMPMSDTRFSDLMPPAWNNNGLSQGTGSAAFLKAKTGVIGKVEWLLESWVLVSVEHLQV